MLQSCSAIALDQAIGPADGRGEVRVDRRRESEVEEVRLAVLATTTNVLRPLHEPNRNCRHERVEGGILLQLGALLDQHNLVTSVELNEGVRKLTARTHSLIDFCRAEGEEQSMANPYGASSLWRLRNEPSFGGGWHRSIADVGKALRICVATLTFASNMNSSIMELVSRIS